MNFREEFQINKPGEGYKASLRSRVIVAILLIVILAPAIFVGSWYFFGIMAIFLAVAIFEICKAPGKKYGWWVWAFTYLVTFLYVYWFVLKANIGAYLEDPEHYVFSLEEYFGGLSISIIGIAVTLGGYFTIALFDKNFDKIAEAIAKGVCAAVGVTYKQPEAKPTYTEQTAEYGDRNSYVYAVKTIFKAFNTAGIVKNGVDKNGIFGDGTKGIVLELQKMFGLSQTGEINDDLISKSFDLLADTVSKYRKDSETLQKISDILAK